MEGFNVFGLLPTFFAIGIIGFFVWSAIRYYRENRK